MSRLRTALGRIWKDIRTYWPFALVFIVYDALVQLVFGAFCPIAVVAGLPCPGCGMTRAVFFFATGQFERGWAMNPIGIGWLILAVYFCVMRYWFGKSARGLMEAGGVLIVCMVVFYVFRMSRYFPGDAPLCYTEGCLLERAVPGYRSFVFRFFGG